MRSGFISILIILTFLVTCCNGDKNIYSGTETIDNELFGTGPYYANGFSIPTGEKVSTLSNPLDVIVLLTNPIVANESPAIYFSVNNYSKSFYRFGQYPDESTASQIFDNLTSFTAPQWKELGDSIRPHQIWLFRTSDEKYAKIRIINTFIEIRASMPFPYAECTFEWVFQPDGTQSFPGK